MASIKTYYETNTGTRYMVRIPLAWTTPYDYWLPGSVTGLAPLPQGFRMRHCVAKNDAGTRTRSFACQTELVSTGFQVGRGLLKPNNAGGFTHWTVTGLVHESYQPKKRRKYRAV